MKFKEGYRVRVLRFDGREVYFYGTLKHVERYMANLFDCTIKKYEGMAVLLPSDDDFGKDKEDYFVLAEDEEDTEAPVIQHTTDNVNHPDHYNYGDIEVIDFAEQVANKYPPKLAPHVYNAIKYLSRATLKNGQEDIKKAKFSVQRLFDKWE